MRQQRVTRGEIHLVILRGACQQGSPVKWCMPFSGHRLRSPTRREFLVGSAAVAAAATLVYPVEVERHQLSVLQVPIYIADLPTAFHGFRIAQISDFHYTRWVEQWFLRETVAAVNALKPDMVALTGDFITAESVLQNNRRHEAICAEILSGLNCPLRYCSLGNHDSIDFPGVIDALTRNGLTVLRNTYTSVDVQGDRLWVGGLADAFFDAPDMTRAVPPRKDGEPVVLLGHEPDIATVVQQHGGVDLMLAGHTHGGQVRLPLLTPYFLPDLGRDFVHGRFNLRGLQLYVNRGIGTVHLPVRFRCPPEITVLTLQPGQPERTSPQAQFG